jgi:hypothetical protein
VEKKLLGLFVIAVAASLVAGTAGANSLDVNSDAALGGSVGTACGGSPCGLEVILTDTASAYVESDHPNQERHVDITFNLDPNDVVLPDRPNGTPGRFRVMKGYREAGNNPRQHLFVTLKRNNTNTQYRLAILQRNDAGNFEFVGEFFVGNTDNEIRIDWTGADVGMNNGSVVVYRNGVQRASLTGIDNDTWNIDMVRMGAIDEIDTGVAGSVYQDEYVSLR